MNNLTAEASPEEAQLRSSLRSDSCRGGGRAAGGGAMARSFAWETIALGSRLLGCVLLLDSALADIPATVAGGAVDVQDGGGSIPEPTTLWLVALGAGWLGLHRLRRSGTPIRG